MRHRDLYPEQYAHPLVGKLVRWNARGVCRDCEPFICERVISTRFGMMVPDPRTRGIAYRLEDMQEVTTQ